jgi:hypothetical protein
MLQFSEDLHAICEASGQLSRRAREKWIRISDMGPYTIKKSDLSCGSRHYVLAKLFIWDSCFFQINHSCLKPI